MKGIKFKSGFMDVLPLYFNEHVIKHYEIDASGRFSLAALANHVQENAAEHARRLKVGYRELHANKHIWMLARARFTWFSSPPLGARIESETWVKDYDRLFSYRDFHFKNEDEIFAVANTAWLVADLASKKIVPVEQYVKNAFQLKDRCLVCKDLSKLPDMEGKAEHVFQHKVKFSSIDLNHHVNNVSFLQWYLDYLPNQLELTSLRELMVNYLHEIKLKDKVNIYYAIKQEAAETVVNCEMVNAATDQAACRIKAYHKKA